MNKTEKWQVLLLLTVTQIGILLLMDRYFAPVIMEARPTAIRELFLWSLSWVGFSAAAVSFVVFLFLMMLFPFVPSGRLGFHGYLAR